MRRAMAILVLVLSGSLAAQSLSDTIIEREHAKLQAEHTAKGLDAFYLSTYAGVNQRGQPQTVQPGSTFQTLANPKFILEEPLTVQVYESAVVVTGIQVPDGARRVRFVRVWVRDGHDWKIAFHQGTSIGQAQANTTSGPPVGHIATPLPALSREEAAILRVQKTLSDAYAQHDAKKYERWTAPEFVGVTDSGQVVPREQWVKNTIVENQRVPSVNDDVKVRIFGDVAVITCRTATPRPDGTVALPERTIRIVAKKHGAWQQVLVQSTAIRDANTTQ